MVLQPSLTAIFLYEVGFEPTNHKGLTLKVSEFDRSSTHTFFYFLIYNKYIETSGDNIYN